MKKIINYIDGKFQESTSKEFSSVYDPSTGEEISQVQLSNEQDLINTIKSSINSFDDWSNTTPLKRSRIISNFKNLIEKNIVELAELISKEHGKTIEDAKG